MNSTDTSPARKHPGIYSALDNQPINLLDLDDEEFALWERLRESAKQILSTIQEARKRFETTLAERGRAVSPWCAFGNQWGDQLISFYGGRGVDTTQALSTPIYQIYEDLSSRIGVALGLTRLGTGCADELERLSLDYEERREDNERDGWDSLAQATGVDRKRLQAIGAGADCTFGELQTILEKLQLRPVCVPLLSDEEVRNVPDGVAPRYEVPLEEILPASNHMVLKDLDHLLHERGYRIAFRTAGNVFASKVAKSMGATIAGKAPAEGLDDALRGRSQLGRLFALHERRRRLRYPK